MRRHRGKKGGRNGWDFFSSTPSQLRRPFTQDCLAALRWCLSDLYRPGDSFHFLHVAPARHDRGDAFCKPDALERWSVCAALEHAQAAILDKFVSAVDEVGVRKRLVKKKGGGDEKKKNHRFDQTNPHHHQAPYHVAIDHVPADSTDAVADAICARARAVSAALVVLPAHNRRGGGVRFGVGSVTRAVIDRSPATVAVMRHGG